MKGLIGSVRALILAITFLREPLRLLWTCRKPGMGIPFLSVFCPSSGKLLQKWKTLGSVPL